MPAPSTGVREAVQPSEPLSPANAGEICLRLSENPTDYISDEAMAPPHARCAAPAATWHSRRIRKIPVSRSRSRARCRMSKKAQSIALLREAAAVRRCRGQLRNLRVLISPGTAATSTRCSSSPAPKPTGRCARLPNWGIPFSTQMLAVLLDRGETVKRDPAAARYWAERAVANPAKDASKADLLVLLGRLLAASDDPQERGRGLEILEKLSAPGHYQFGARTALGAGHSQAGPGAGANLARGSPSARSRRCRRRLLRKC